jgi:hypothetical protein
LVTDCDENSLSLTSEQQTSLKNSLVHWMTFYASNGRDVKVVRKLSTALAGYYLATLDGLDTFVSHLIFSCAGLDVSLIDDTVNIRTVEKNVLQSLSKEVILMVLWCITALAEEAGRKNSSLNSAQYAKLNHSFSMAMRDIVYVLDFVHAEFDVPNDPKALNSCRTTAMSALSATKYFYINVCQPSDDMVAGIKQTLAHAINWVNISRSPDAIKELSDLLINDRIFDDSHYDVIEQILTTWGKDKLQNDILDDLYTPDGEPDGCILELLLAYTDSRMAHLLEEATGSSDPSRPRAHTAGMILGTNAASMCCPALY